MAPGPRPLPIEMRKARGNPQRRPIPDAPGPVAGGLRCPPHLSAAAKAAWHATASAMTVMGTLGAECGPTLERYAVSLVRWREAEARVVELGAVIAAPRTGVLMGNPWLSVARGEADRLLRIEAELGLTPSARGRVTKAPTVEPGKDSPWARLQALQLAGSRPL